MMSKNHKNLLIVCLALAVTLSAIATRMRAADESDSSDATLEVVEDSMHEFMEYVYQPTYKRLKASMAAEPSDNAGWKAIKADSLVLAESTNLLLIRTPEENGGEWDKAAVATRKLAAELYRAAGKKEFETATTAYKSMLTNCNACHKTFAEGKHQLTP
jgi:hypothetical protein